jgi:hypothetical protein
VGLGELVQPLSAEFAADAAGVEPAERARSSTAVALWLLKNVTPVRNCLLVAAIQTGSRSAVSRSPSG